MHVSIRLGAAAVLGLLLCGCDSGPKMRYDAVQIVTASGRVTLDGEPLAAALVKFEDQTNGTCSFGLTDASGNYKLQLDSVKTGVTPGKKAVRISTTEKILGVNSDKDPNESSEGAAKPAAEPEKVPEKFNKKSELTADVTTAQTEYNFDLKSK